MMTLFSALRRAIGATLAPDLPGAALYDAIVNEARRPDYYLAGEVPDSFDGRFDMVALVHSLVLMQLEREAGNTAAAQLSADLTERFITDMDGTLRQDGVGDQVVGKHIGRMVAALGGRLGAYRDAGDDDAALAEALRRNLWRGGDIDAAAVAWVTAETRKLEQRLKAVGFADLAAGNMGGIA